MDRLLMTCLLTLASACAGNAEHPGQVDPSRCPTPDSGLCEPLNDAGDGDASACKTSTDINGQVVTLCPGESTSCLKMLSVSWQICPSSIYCRETRRCMPSTEEGSP